MSSGEIHGERRIWGFIRNRILPPHGEGGRRLVPQTGAEGAVPRPPDSWQPSNVFTFVLVEFDDSGSTEDG